MRKFSVDISVLLHAASRVVIKFVLHILISAAYGSWKDHWK